MRPVLLSLLFLAFLFSASSCASVKASDPRILAPQEFSCRTEITRNGFSAEATLTRTGIGTYALQYLAPDTIYGLTYTWMAGEQTCELGMLEETTAGRSENLFGRLVEALDTYYNTEELPVTQEERTEGVQYVYKEFTILASAENGQILEIHFPQRGLLIQMKEEKT